MNNFEKIKQMSVDEMAECISETPNCGKCTLADLDLILQKINEVEDE